MIIRDKERVLINVIVGDAILIGNTISYQVLEGIKEGEKKTLCGKYRSCCFVNVECIYSNQPMVS